MHSKLVKLMHFDSDKENRSLNDEFVRAFGEKPPKVIIDTFDLIGNPFKRMVRMYELIEVIIA